MWFDEHADYDFSSGNCRSGMCGHYTQLVWASTTHVGCGVRDCGFNANFPYGLSIVCNYGPGGNMIGELPYEQGTNSDCNKDTVVPDVGQLQKPSENSENLPLRPSVPYYAPNPTSQWNPLPSTSFEDVDENQPMWKPVQPYDYCRYYPCFRRSVHHKRH
ncbi:GLIPR1 protein 1 [Fasciola gigantica]|uniref:GLIPR1 protein 1 n=1 Tax=Fasciola gigantica TaxID=46835 RepID=A0A504YYJ3_FASGI|nr:GLIPR1 protein 1 [Fasciola gigantica]